MNNPYDADLVCVGSRSGDMFRLVVSGPTIISVWRLWSKTSNNPTTVPVERFLT